MLFILIFWFINYYLFKFLLTEQIFCSYKIFLPINYLLFELTHLMTHKYNGSNKILKNAKLYHKLQHVDDKTNFSFVTPLWDFIFGTLSIKYKISLIELLVGFFPFLSFIVRNKSDD